MTIRAQTGPGASSTAGSSSLTIAEAAAALSNGRRPARRPLPSPLDSPPLPDLSRLAVLAAGLLLIDDARLCGLIDGDARIDRGRCSDVLAAARARGIVPDPDETAAAAVELMGELGMLRP